MFAEVKVAVDQMYLARVQYTDDVCESFCSCSCDGEIRSVFLMACKSCLLGMVRPTMTRPGSE